MWNPWQHQGWPGQGWRSCTAKSPGCSFSTAPATTLLPFRRALFDFLVHSTGGKQLKQKHSRQTGQLQATSEPTSQMSRQVPCRKGRIWKDLMGLNFP